MKNYSVVTPHITPVQSHMMINASSFLSSDMQKGEIEDVQQKQKPT